MGLSPTYYLADFMTGDLLEPLPNGAVSGVSLSSSLKPGRFSATVNLEAAGFTMAEGRAWVDSIRAGVCTIVPVLEGVTNGDSITSRELGEWWLCAAKGTYQSPEVVISGPEWDGYGAHVLVAEAVQGSVDPVKTARELLGLLYSTSQDVAVNLQEWVSHTGARVDADIRETRTTYVAAIEDLQTAPDGPFEWMTRTGLVLDGWVPRRVTRTLEIGQPRLAFDRPDVTLEITAPGKPHASLLDADWGWDKRNAPSTIYGFGAGAGDDQPALWESRSRVPSEPAVNALVTDPAAGSDDQLRRFLRSALAKYTPDEKVFAATMPTASYTPMRGDRYNFLVEPGWSQHGRDGHVQCAGWSWTDSNPDVYALELVEV